MSYPFMLPSGNEYTKRKPPSEMDVVGAGSPGKPIAMYYAEKLMADDLYLLVFEWVGTEHKEKYVLMLVKDELTPQTVHMPEYRTGFFSRDSLISAVRDFIKVANKTPDAVISEFENRQYEPWDSQEEYEEFLEEEQEEADWVRERSEIHTEARDEWAEEKHSRQIVKELEQSSDELNLPDIPRVNEEVEELNKQYANGNISLLELENKLEAIMDKQDL